MGYFESMCFVSAFKADKMDKVGVHVKKNSAWDVIYVSGIKTDSKFASSKLQVGMAILTINGISCPKTVREITDLIRECEGPLTLVAAKTIASIDLTTSVKENGAQDS